MSGKVTRRDFIKGGLAAACTVAASAAVPEKAKAKTGEDQLATLLDISKCVGCEACVEACQEVNEAKYPEPQKPFPKMVPKRAKVSDWSDRRDVNDRLTPYNWLYIQRAEVEIDGEDTEVNLPRRCMHCVNPPCVKLCPFGAAKQALRNRGPVRSAPLAAASRPVSPRLEAGRVQLPCPLRATPLPRSRSAGPQPANAELLPRAVLEVHRDRASAAAKGRPWSTREVCPARELGIEGCGHG